MVKPQRALQAIALAATLPNTIKAQSGSDSSSSTSSSNRRPSLSETLKAHNDTLSTLNSYIQTRQDLFAAINSTSDITILAPSNDALNGLFSNSAVMADFNSDPDLVEAFWNYHVLKGVWWTSNLTSGTSTTSTSAAKKKRKKRDGTDIIDEDGLDGQSLFIPTLLDPDITSYANVSGGQRVIARSSTSSSNGETVVSFYSGTTSNNQQQKSTITHANFNFSGGTIHIIDHVLTLPSRLNDTLASFGPSSSSSSSSSTNQNDDTSDQDLLSLTASVGALSRANLTNLFNTQRDITMFVPSNSAWNSVGSVVSDMDEDELAKIMGYHVLSGTGGRVFYSDLLEQAFSSDDSSGGSSGGDSGSSDVESGGTSGTEYDDEDDQREFEKDYDTVEGGKVKVRVVDGSGSSSGNGKEDDDGDDDGGSGETQVFVNGARVVKSDVLVENGVVHIVDG
ncbi:FAS1 domain-containing protein [Sordaria brevicollis]|uniref:FAS1 domain-containing protein n=1 Tax=Sordaria brevicollis TaxID=83679 RepID=A0AAE0PNU4_SORBR|nr:FAS1 domain-containing protein [Sordaria brevicollis]